MKKNINNIYAFLLMLLLGVAGCKKMDDKFLVTNPETFYTVDNIFSTSAQVDQAVISIYSQLRDIWANPNEENWIFMFRGNGTDIFDVPSIGGRIRSTIMVRSMPIMPIFIMLSVRGTRALQKPIWPSIARSFPTFPGRRPRIRHTPWPRPAFSGLLLIATWPNFSEASLS